MLHGNITCCTDTGRAPHSATFLLETSPISHIDTAAVHTVTGRSQEIDVLVLATRFKVMESENMPAYWVRGPGGLDQAKWWDENRLQAYEGVSVPGHPNHFSVFGPYGYNGSSYFMLIEAQAGHILRCLRQARSRAANYIEVTREANDRLFTEMLKRRGARSSGNPAVQLAIATTSTSMATFRYARRPP